MKDIISLLLIISLVMSCGPKAVDEKVLLDYIRNEENGLSHFEEFNSYKVRLTYKTSDQIVKQQIEKGSPREVDSLRSLYNCYVYFILVIEKNSKDLETDFAYDPSTFADKISYLTTSFSQNITLSTSFKTYSVSDYLYARSFGSGPSNFLIVFEKPELQDFDVVVEGHDLGFGKIRFPFSQRDLNKAPLLKL